MMKRAVDKGFIVVLTIFIVYLIASLIKFVNIYIEDIKVQRDVRYFIEHLAKMS